ncbi:hypothetical protein [Streptomyces sp. NBC_01304]|uniref:hypothetical protein n=1 Tax=Streptomyces sp. NBC_01304 TaxID=2903818 RepID=UPI002E14BB7A|nr:hypothetical protein OG430_40965 [Streptomyces sp. NBC_01304]
MRIGARLRGEFPRGWWRSTRWWITGTRDLALSTAAAVATVVFAGEMMRAVRHRDEPRTLARPSGTFERYTASLLINSAGLVALLIMTIEDGLLVVLTALLTGWCLLNIVISATVLVVVAQSRIRQPAAWAKLDFVEQHAPRYGRPPETIEEYRAQQLQDVASGKIRSSPR